MPSAGSARVPLASFYLAGLPARKESYEWMSAKQRKMGQKKDMVQKASTVI